MKKDDVKIGGTYLAKVSNNVVQVRIDAAHPRGGWDATNLSTNKQIRIKSAQRLRGPAPQREAGQRARVAGDAQEGGAGDTALAATTPAQRDTIAREPKEKRASGLDAAARVLKEAGEPMRCGDMVEKMLATGLWKTGGKTPAATIYSAIVREIGTKGAASRFRKTDRGLFTVNAQ